MYDRTVYHWGSQIGDESYSTFNEFMAACGADAVELEPFVTPGVSIGGGTYSVDLPRAGVRLSAVRRLHCRPWIVQGPA